MILFLLTIDLLALSLLASAYALVAREARRGRDIVLELTDYRHMAEDMLPVLRNLVLYAMLIFVCLVCMQAGQTWVNSH